MDNFYHFNRKINYDNVYYYCSRFECNYSEFYGQKYYAGYFSLKELYSIEKLNWMLKIKI